MELSTHICGIPCMVEFTVHGKYVPARIWADPNDCYEAQYPEIEFTVCDRRGRPAPWLEKKMTDSDKERIDTEIEESMQ